MTPSGILAWPLEAWWRSSSAQGVLELEDARVAAAHFNWLVMSIPLTEAMPLGRDEPATAAELRRYADAGVRAFLAAYGKQ